MDIFDTVFKEINQFILNLIEVLFPTVLVLISVGGVVICSGVYLLT